MAGTKKKPPKSKSTRKPAKKAAKKPAKKPAKKSTKKPTKQPAKKPTNPVLANGARGKQAIDSIVAHITGPNAPSDDPRPLSDAEVKAFEQAANAAMSPALFAVLSVDAGAVARDYGWFDKKMQFQARPFAELVAEHAGPFASFYESLFERFPGKAIIGEEYDGEWFNVIYFGDPDEHGEYPVLFFHFRDEPYVNIQHAGTDVWLAFAHGMDTGEYAADCVKTAQRLFGADKWEAFGG